MLKIFLTGDNHIGLKYSNHPNSQLLAQSRIDALSDMVDIANNNQCDIFVIAGDLFENTYGISKKDVVAVMDILEKFKGVVAILPGNHDYYDKDTKLWQYVQGALASKDNILVMTQFVPYQLSHNEKEIVFYPALCLTHHSQPGKNNLDWIKSLDIPTDSVYRIGIAHGSVEGETMDKEQNYFQMSHSELELIPLDVWLLGHTHVPFNGERLFNAGTHQQTDVNCNTAGNCFIINIDEDKKVTAQSVKTGRLQFHRIYITVKANSFENTIMSQLENIDDNSVVDLILEGAISSDEYESRTQIIDSALSRFVEGSCNDSKLSRLISAELISKEFAETSFAADLLNELLDTPRQAQLAYELLKSLGEDK